MQHFIEFVINHWMLWGLLGAVSVALIYTELTSSDSVPQVSPQQATNLINKSHAVVVDIRSAEAFQQGHITGAISCPSETIVKDNKKLEKYKNKPLILACENGNNSTQMVSTLRKANFGQVVALKGGLNGWSAASMPLIKSKQP